MKKIFELLLLVPLVIALVFLVFAYRTGALADFFATDNPTPNNPGTEDATPTSLATLIPYSTSTPFLTNTPTLTPRPFSTPTRTSTPTSTLTATPTQTASSTPVGQEITSGIAIGNQIIQAIEAYYLDRGFYPATLNELMPTYLSALPVTSTGQPYFYRFFDPAHPLASEAYWLTFRVVEQENTTCTYLRQLLYWDCNFSSP